MNQGSRELAEVISCRPTAPARGRPSSLYTAHADGAMAFAERVEKTPSTVEECVERPSFGVAAYHDAIAAAAVHSCTKPAPRRSHLFYSLFPVLL
jgi:hypothetical protein